jgi:dTDP-4-amino-4,6-dideoxygalactose transaminase
MSELVGAVGCAQLDKLNRGVERRVKAAALLESMLPAGISLPTQLPDASPSYWRFALLVDLEIGGPNLMAEKLRGFGIPSAPRYIQKPAFRCGLFENQKTFGSSRYPFSLARPDAVDYSDYPGTLSYLERVLVLPWNENYTEEIAERLGHALAA